MMIVFHIPSYHSSVFGKVWKPEAEFYFINGEFKKRTKALIDSGADITVIPKGFGDSLGLIIKDDDKVREFRGATEGAVPFIEKKLRIEIGGYQIEARVGWALIDEVPFLLGRLDIFSRFDIEFKQEEEKVTFKEKRIPPLPRI